MRGPPRGGEEARPGGGPVGQLEVLPALLLDDDGVDELEVSLLVDDEVSDELDEDPLSGAVDDEVVDEPPPLDDEPERLSFL